MEERKVDELIANIRNPNWYPTKEYAASCDEALLTNSDVLRAVLDRCNTNLFKRRPVGSKTVWRMSGRIHDGRLIFSYAEDVYCATDYWDNNVPIKGVVYGSLWRDLEYHEKNKTPKAKVSTEPEEMCCGESEPNDAAIPV